MQADICDSTCVVWGTYDLGKPRTRILVSAAHQVFHEVLEQHVEVWRGIEDKTQLKSASAKLGVALRWVFAYPVLITRYLLAPKHSVVLIPYMGLIDVLVIYPFAKLRGAKICLDIFISIYDTTVIDRKLLSDQSIFSKLLYHTERLAIEISDVTLIDTKVHGLYVEELFELPLDSIQPVWVGVECESFPRRVVPTRERAESDRIKILFYGQFIPLHGLDVVVKAAELLERAGETAYEWVLIGRGQLQAEIDETISALHLSSVTRVDWVPYEQLVDEIFSSAVCLGVFQADGKSQRVIPNKVFQILAAGVPLITADSPAMRELLISGADGVTLIAPGDPVALVDAIVQVSSSIASGEAFSPVQMPVVDSTLVARQFLAALQHL